jgi:O-antigen polymerase
VRILFDSSCKGLNVLFVLSLGVLIVILPFSAREASYYPFQAGMIFFGWWVILFLIAIKCTLPIVRRESLQFNIRTLDGVLFLYVLFIITHVLFINNVPPEPIFIFEQILLIVMYILFRTTECRNLPILVVFFFLSAFAQSLYGVFQAGNYLLSKNPYFCFTGSFFNPGPFAGFLGSLLPAALEFFVFYFYLNRLQHKRIYSVYLIVGLLTSVSILMILPFTGSRAAWAGALTGLLYLGWHHSDYGKVIKTFKLGVLILATFGFIVIVNTGLYSYKKDSVEGRLLIWKVSGGMIADRPILGHGIGQFRAKYMDYQASYFRNNPDSPEGKYAANTSFAYNEFLKICAEQGITGMFFLLLIISHIFQKGSSFPPFHNYLPISAKSGLIAIIVFGCFSYPLAIMPMKICIVFFISIIAREKKCILKIGNNSKGNVGDIHSAFRLNYLLGYGIIFLLLFFITFTGVLLHRAERVYKAWRSSFKSYEMSYSENTLESCSKIYPVLKNNGQFNAMYGHALLKSGKFEMSIEVLNRACLSNPTTSVHMDLGDSYKAMGLFKKAEEAYFKASYMVPSMYSPIYRLFKLYIETGQIMSANKTAQTIINKQIKVANSEVYYIREEAKLWLRDHNDKGQ